MKILFRVPAGSIKIGKDDGEYSRYSSPLLQDFSNVASRNC